MAGIVDRAISAIIRPPRKQYDLNSLPTTLQTDLITDTNIYIRRPFVFELPRKEKIIASLYYKQGQDVDKGGPCVVYMHGNSSSQLEGQFLVPNFCQYNIFVFCFDFIGCGCSTGNSISLGYFEKQDTEFILNKLHKIYKLGPFVLWGRSMGAATALMVRNQYVRGIISDSSFATLKDLCSNIAKSQGLPSLFVPTAVWYLQKKVNAKANFKLSDVNPLDYVKTNKSLPTLYGHAEKDQFIPLEQMQKLYKAHKNQSKSMVILPGGHNDRRPISWIRRAVSFALEVLKIKVARLNITECRNLQSQDAHCEDFNELLKKSQEPLSESAVEAYQQAGGNLFQLNIPTTDDEDNEEDDNEMVSIDDIVNSNHVQNVIKPVLSLPNFMPAQEFPKNEPKEPLEPFPQIEGNNYTGKIIGKNSEDFNPATETVSKHTVRPRRLSIIGNKNLEAFTKSFSASPIHNEEQQQQENENKEEEEEVPPSPLALPRPIKKTKKSKKKRHSKKYRNSVPSMNRSSILVDSEDDAKNQKTHSEEEEITEENSQEKKPQVKVFTPKKRKYQKTRKNSTDNSQKSTETTETTESTDTQETEDDIGQTTSSEDEVTDEAQTPNSKSHKSSKSKRKKRGRVEKKTKKSKKKNEHSLQLSIGGSLKCSIPLNESIIEPRKPSLTFYSPEPINVEPKLDFNYNNKSKKKRHSISVLIEDNPYPDSASALLQLS